ncbi:MAG: PA2779 family protein [Nitrospirota bacterium]|jgi:hypothetical protein
MFRKWVSWYMIASMLLLAVVPRVEGALSPSEVIKLSKAERAQDMATVRSILENKLVSQRLSDLGYSAEEAQARLGQLSDAQLHSLAQKLDDLNPGGDALGVIVVLLVIAILVVLFLKLYNRQVVIR